MFKFTVFVLSAILACSLAEDSPSWHHSTQDSWGEDFPDCSGKEQSPINLINANETKASPISFNGYATKFKGNDLVLTNNGHSAELSYENIPNEGKPSISGGILGEETYILEQIHFHWGGGNRRGSEHTIDFKAYDLEAHLVHRNSKFESVAEAAGQENGLTVLGFLYEERSALFGYDSDIKQITSILPIIQNEGNTARIKKTFETGKNFPVDKQITYYNYPGSLTTPGCSENVNWIVFDMIQGVAADELKKFRGLKIADGSALIDNYRKVRDLNERNVTLINTDEKKKFEAGKFPKVKFQKKLLQDSVDQEAIAQN
ncbi:CA14.2 family protein [Megaselia abdita]